MNSVKEEDVSSSDCDGSMSKQEKQKQKAHVGKHSQESNKCTRTLAHERVALGEAGNHLPSLRRSETKLRQNIISQSYVKL